MSDTDIVIVSACRTAIGSFGGSFAKIKAHSLGAHAIKEALNRAQVNVEEVSDVIMGQVLTTAQGQNPARQASLEAGLPHDVTAMTINQVCGSGLRSIMLAVQAIKAGDAGIVVAGGQENMSASPHATFLRDGTKMGSSKLIDTMVTDGLWDAFNDYHMGMTAENLAEKYDISREDQDDFAFSSQEKADKAIKENCFKEEIVPVEVPQRKGDPIVFDTDEFPRFSPREKLATMRPAFTKEGTVTAANASGINDGAAAVVVMTRAEANKRGLTPMATIVSYATAGVDPAFMGIGPVPATKQALAKAMWSLEEVDLIEANEAFAAQSCAVAKELGFNAEKVNVNGGAIALGHPIGASGTRCLVTLLHEMQKRDVKKGLVTLCIGGGMGVAMCLER